MIYVRLSALLGGAVALTLVTTAYAQRATKLPDGPAPADYEQQIRNDLPRFIKDPASVQLRQIRAPRKVAIPIMTNDPIVLYGWGACYKLNAKNGYGGYVGEKTYLFIVSETGNVSNMPIDSDLPGQAGFVAGECSKSAD